MNERMNVRRWTGSAQKASALFCAAEADELCACTCLTGHILQARETLARCSRGCGIHEHQHYVVTRQVMRSHLQRISF